MASNSFILPKVMNATRDALKAKGFAWIPYASQIQSGLSGGPLDEDPTAQPDSTNLPNVTCEASDATVSLPNIATYRVNCIVHVAHSAESDGEKNYLVHLDQAGEVFDYLFDDAFFTALTVAGLSVFGIYHTGQTSTRNGRKWIASHSFYVECYGS